MKNCRQFVFYSKKLSTTDNDASNHNVNNSVIFSVYLQVILKDSELQEVYERSGS